MLGIVALVLAVAVGWWLLRPSAAPSESAIPLAGAGSASTSTPGPAGAGTSLANGPAGASTTTSGPTELVVQAAGAVRSPGLYRLAPGARVDDLVRAAGGLAADADADRINLASPVADGERVWIPARGATEVPEVVAGSGGSGGGPPAGAGTGGSDTGTGASEPVDLNAADETELDSLPGVGPATAAAIIAHRSEEGPFGSVDDLLDVRGIGEAKLEQLRPLVVVR